MESVDLAAMQFPADLKSRPANGARGVCRSNWRLALRAQNRFEARRLIANSSLR
jgi:hypothetical protein